MAENCFWESSTCNSGLYLENRNRLLDFCNIVDLFYLSRLSVRDNRVFVDCSDNISVATISISDSNRDSESCRIFIDWSIKQICADNRFSDVSSSIRFSNNISESYICLYIVSILWRTFVYYLLYCMLFVFVGRSIKNSRATTVVAQISTKLS